MSVPGPTSRRDRAAPLRLSSAAMSRRLLSAALTCLALCGAHGLVAAAAPPAPTLPFPAPPPSSCEALAGQLVATLYPADARVGAFAIDVTLQTARKDVAPDALRAHLTSTVEAALRARVASAGARLPAAAEAIEERIDVALLLDGGHLAATARRTRLPTNLWERLATPGGEIIKTAFASWPLDLEIRTLLGIERTAARLDSLRVVPVTERTAALAPAPILDLVVADLDGDRMPELALLQPGVVRVLAWQSGAFTVDRARFDLDVLPPNPARLRAPIGRLVVVTRADGTQLLLAASSDRALPALLILEPGGGTRPAELPAPAGWPLYATGIDSWVVSDWPRGVDVLSGSVSEVRLGGQGAIRVADVDGAYDVRAFPLRVNTSPTWSPVLARAGRGGAFSFWTASAPSPLELAHQGTVAVLVDVDGDGAAELLSTSADVGGRDRLTLSRVLEGARGPRRLWSGEVRAAVTAAACGDVDRDGFREFVVATWDGRAPELLIVVPRT